MNYFFGVILIIFGILGTVSPETMFKFDLRRILYYNHAEPSDFGLCMTRFGSVLMIIIGVLSFFSNEFFINFFDD